MKLFRRNKDSGSDGENRAAAENACIDLTAAIDMDDIEAQVQASNGELDSIEARLQDLLRQSASLEEIDLTKSTKRGTVDTIDLSAMMHTSVQEDGGVGRWFDGAFADVDED